MTVDKTIKLGDDLPLLEYTLTDAVGVIDLTGATVKLKLAPMFGTATIIDVVCTIIAPLLGTVRYHLQTADIAALRAAAARFFNYEFEVKFPDGSEVTCPNNRYLVLEALPEL